MPYPQGVCMNYARAPATSVGGESAMERQGGSEMLIATTLFDLDREAAKTAC